MIFGVGVGLLSLMAVIFVLWRLRYRPHRDGLADNELNRSLFVEKINQLQLQLEAQEIDNSQFASLKLEYERQFLLEAEREQQESPATVTTMGRWLPISTALLIPVIAVVLYSQIGAFDALSLRQVLEQRSDVIMSQPVDSARLAQLNNEVIGGLARLTQKNTEEPLYPVLLAQLYMDQGDHDLAVNAYKRAVALLPENGEIRAEYAQALFFAANNRVTEEMEAQAKMALRFFPNNQTALGLMGIASFHNEHYRDAVGYWQRALSFLPEGSPSRNSLESGIAAAQSHLGEDVQAAKPVSLLVKVSAPGIDLPPQTTVFVYARQWQGSPMPLAIQRMTLADLPATVELNDAMAMNTAARLSSAGKVELVARVSIAGMPASASGDWQAQSGEVNLAGEKTEFELVIDQQIP